MAHGVLLTDLGMEDERKGSDIGNYRPIACLPTTFSCSRVSLLNKYMNILTECFATG